jgi:SAM-dependent methyltransferase
MRVPIGRLLSPGKKMEILVSDSPVKAGPNGKAYPEPKKVSLATIHEDFARLGKAEFFAGVVFDELERMRDRPALTALDVGCGGGFHHRPDLQAQIGSRTSRFLGVEPDPDAHVQAEFAAIYRSTLEGADLPPNSVDLAYAVMVLEHVADAESFFAKLDSVLKPGGCSGASRSTGVTGSPGRASGCSAWAEGPVPRSAARQARRGATNPDAPVHSPRPCRNWPANT